MKQARGGLVLVRALLVIAVALAGCGVVPAPARDAAQGAFDAIQNPPKEDRLARDLRTLVQRYAEQALEAGPPDDLGELAARITTAVIGAVEEPTLEQRALVRRLVGEALRAATATMKEELPALERAGARLAPVVDRGHRRDRGGPAHGAGRARGVGRAQAVIGGLGGWRIADHEGGRVRGRGSRLADRGSRITKTVACAVAARGSRLASRVSTASHATALRAVLRWS